MPTVRLQRALGRPGQRAAARLALSCGPLELVLRSRTGRSPTCCCATPTGFRARATLMAGDVRPRLRRLLGAADRAAVVGGSKGGKPPVRRIMVEAGERFWRRAWRPPLRCVCEGNPFAAMPSLHFGTSVMAARVLSGVGPGRRAPRLGLCADARVRARLPGRALRHRPDRRLRARRGRLAARRPRPAGGRAVAHADPAAGAGAADLMSGDEQRRSRRRSPSRTAELDATRGRARRTRRSDSRFGAASRDRRRIARRARCDRAGVRRDLLASPEDRRPRRHARPDRATRPGTGS